jgi:aerotaxis receptor
VKTTQPVTGHARTFDEGVTLMSVTDLDSRITYANEAFVQISGFERHELIGQPHNIVRHPDMPRQAFADMWATLKSGESWTGLVKNRCKNGDHYWVRANVTPVHRAGSLIGYMSVRTCPTDAEVARAERLYARARSADRLRIRKGFAVADTPLAGWRIALAAWPVAWTLRLSGLPPLAGALGVWAGGGHPAGMVAATALGAAASAAWTSRHVGRRLRQVLAQALAAATGEPSVRQSHSHIDELAVLSRAIDQAGLNLAALLGDVAQQAQGVASVSHQMAAANQELWARTEATAMSLDTTVDSMTHLGQAVRHTADAARRADGLAAAANDAASDGGHAVHHVVHTMADITRCTDRIGGIIGVIDDIAFQTNMLALNASVEAARAGAHGKGFAVVAGEVRMLAQRSAKAAQEVRDLIQHSRQRVEDGDGVARNAGLTMTHIVTQVGDVSALIRDISEASTEQSGNIDQLARTVGELDQLTQQNASMVAQSAVSAEALKDSAQRLVDVVNLFRG